MSELRLYRMPDDYNTRTSTWILSLNGVALSQATTGLDHEELPFAHVPRDVLGLAIRLESALNVKVQYCDRRLAKQQPVRLHVVRCSS